MDVKPGCVRASYDAGRADHEDAAPVGDLLDGVYLAALMAPIGGSHSVLVFLVYLHLVAVTLLISHRAGLKLAVWQGLLMVVGQWAAVTGLAARPFGLASVRVSD